MDILLKIAETLVKVKQKKPLVHHLTNYVTVNDCANITLAIGGSPVMANDPSEVEEMVSLASALVLNIGTLNSQLVESMIAAGKRATALNIPVLFDPVGVGATQLRMVTAERIIREVRPTVIKGNMSEIKELSGFKVGSRGVDSTADEDEGEIVAINLSRRLGCIVAITGKNDIIARDDDVFHVHNGHALLTGVTGAGCMTNSLVGCCCGSGDDYLIATIAGITVMGLAGEVAHQLLKPEEGIGTFRMRLLDAVSNMTSDLIMNYGKISYRTC